MPSGAAMFEFSILDKELNNHIINIADEIGTIDDFSSLEERIRSLKDVDSIIKIARSEYNIRVSDLLVEKALEHEEEIVPILLEKYKRSGQDSVIEFTMKLLAFSNKDYSDEILEILDQIRNPNAISYACVTLGVISEKNIVETMYKKFIDLKKFYPSKSYEQGPLLAISRNMGKLNLKKYELIY